MSIGTSKPEKIKRTLEETRELLKNGDLEAAHTAIEGLSTDTSCPICDLLEDTIVGGVAFARLLDTLGRDDERERAVAITVDVIDTFESEL